MKGLSTLAGLLAGALPRLAYGSQAPFHADIEAQHWQQPHASGPWNFDVAPSPNATENFIFETVSSLLQQWPNTRYRNGHTIVPVTIPANTLLYHGTWHKEIPSTPEWVATDPEHSYLFCRTIGENEGCWQLTLAVTRPLKVLYFDGSSAAKMPGCMDTQDMIVWGRVEPSRLFDERTRIKDFCAWGKKYNLDGYLRMEPNFEIMLCDFAKDVEVISFLNLVPVLGNEHGPPPPKKNATKLQVEDRRDPRYFATYRVIESGHTHNRFPGETRAQPDLTRLISFYDTDMFPSLIESRYNQERFFHRIESIVEEDRQRFLQRLDDVLSEPQSPGSGVDWTSLIRVIKHRYVERLEVLQYMLNQTVDANETLWDVHVYTQSMLAPYILNDAKPANDSSVSREWAAPIFEQCASTHTKTARTTLHSRLTPSEQLILKGVDGVLHEICRVLVGLWADGVVKLEVADAGPFNLVEVVTDWRTRINNPVHWLDWSEWVKCNPSCDVEETCYLPTWPWLHGAEWPRRPRPPPDTPPGAHNPGNHSLKWDRTWGWVKDFSLDGGEGEDDYWRRPQPKCIRRVFPFENL